MAEGLVNKLELISESELDFSRGERAYEGMSGKTKLRVTSIRDCLFVSRVYGTHRHTRIQITWGFNRFGRIGFIEGTLLPKKKELLLLEVVESEKLFLDYNEISLKAYDFPERMGKINPGFNDYPSGKKLELLLRFGHSACMGLYYNIVLNNINYSKSLSHTSGPLTEIIQDKEAIYMLNQAGLILPSVRPTRERDVFKLDYKQRQLNQESRQNDI